jgi:hypothetical protein
MRKRKALKGGYIKGQAASSGPTLKEPLNKINEDNLENIKKTYDGLYEKSKEDVELALAIKKAREQEYNNAQKTELSNFARIEKSTIENKKLAFKAVSGFFGFITKFIGSVINFFRQFTAYAIKQLFHGGQGVFLKAFMAIVVIIGIFVGFTYGIDLFNKDTALSSYNDIRQNIINTDYEKYLTMPNSDTYMAKIQDKMNSMIPNSFKYKWSSFYNSASYMVTGKNKYDMYLEERKEIDTGRCDDIFHINFKETSDKYQMERTYSIIAPKDVILKYNNNLYNDSDYNRIDSNIKELVNKYHSTCIIPIKPNENTGKYELKLNSNMYFNDSNVLLLRQSNLIKSIFDNDLKFASFNNISYTGYYDSGNIIGAYATKLINPNYKGPILRLTTANNDEINTGNENKKGKKTANFYNEYNTLELYTIIDNKKISYKEFFPNNASSVATIYDQSGNNNHLIYKQYVFIHMPELKQDNDKQYAIWFYDQHMLVFIKTILYSKININTKILFNNIDNPVADDLRMNFLATKNAPVIEIRSTDYDSLVFHTTKNTDNDFDNSKQISDKYKTDVINKNWTAQKNPYTITTKNIYNENKDPIILECLGNAYDVRTENEKNSIDAIQGKNLQNALRKNSFKGYLYELRIFKSDD